MAILTSNFWMDLLVILSTLVVILITYIKWSFTYWDKIGMVSLTPTFPFGNFKDLFLQKAGIGESVTTIYNQLKGKGHKYMGGYFFTRPILFLLDAELVKNIMIRDFDHFVNRGLYVNEEKDPLAAHLFSLGGTRWRNLRVKLTPTFTSGKMKMMFQTLVNCSDGLTKVLGDFDGNPVDIRDIAARYTTDVIGTCAFGLDCNSLNDPNTKFRVYGKRIFDPSVWEVVKGFFAFSAPSLLKFFNTVILNTDVANFFANVVRETIDYREKNNVTRKDFMDLLIQLKNTGRIEDEENEKPDVEKPKEGLTTLTFEQIAAQAFLFFAAGFETSSTTMTFCLYELVKNINIQEKVRQEINEVLERHDGQITYEAITMEMKYMENVVNETLRKYPPLAVLSRECTKEYKVPEIGLHVEEGMVVLIPVEAIQLDPKYYPNPEVFDPDRFNKQEKKANNPYTFLPFGQGPRTCLGLRFGMMQIKVAITVLLKNFKFTLNDKTREPFVIDPKPFITTVRDGVFLNATKI